MAKKLTEIQKELKAKHKIFISEYLIDFNGTRAAREAGYEEKNASSEAHNLLRKPKIAAKIKKAMAKRFEDNEKKSKKVIEQLSKIAFAKMGHVASWDEDGLVFINSNFIETDAVQEVQFNWTKAGPKKKIKLYDKVKALAALGEALGMYDREDPGSDEDHRETNEKEILQDIQELSEEE